MKISTQWSQRDWDNALSKVWKLARNFDEILEFGLEHGYITSSDIIHASDMYRDPNKEYDEAEVKEVITSYGLPDTMRIIQEEYDLDDIINELPEDDILDCYDDDTLYERIENSGFMEDVKEEIKSDLYTEYIDEWTEEFEIDSQNKSNNLINNADELHTLICNISECGYYENGLEKLKEKLNKNNYGVKYE